MEQFVQDLQLIKEDKLISERMLKARWNDYVQSKRERANTKIKAELLLEYAELSTQWLLKWKND